MVDFDEILHYVSDKLIVGFVCWFGDLHINFEVGFNDYWALQEFDVFLCLKGKIV